MFHKVVLLVGQFVKDVISQSEQEINLERDPNFASLAIEICTSQEPFLFLFFMTIVCFIKTFYNI
jgi:hypothetical protein